MLLSQACVLCPQPFCSNNTQQHAACRSVSAPGKQQALMQLKLGRWGCSYRQICTAWAYLSSCPQRGCQLLCQVPGSSLQRVITAGRVSLAANCMVVSDLRKADQRCWWCRNATPINVLAVSSSEQQDCNLDFRFSVVTHERESMLTSNTC